MKKYSQLTQEQRYQIYAFLKVNFSMTDIAKEIGVHKSTISREFKRNKGDPSKLIIKPVADVLRHLSASN